MAVQAGIVSRMNQKQQKKLFRELKRAGWRLEQYSKGMKCFSPDGQSLVIVHTSPSENRAGKNLLSEFRRAGFDPDGRKDSASQPRG
jgi:hypothetical protein